MTVIPPSEFAAGAGEPVPVGSIGDGRRDAEGVYLVRLGVRGVDGEGVADGEAFLVMHCLWFGISFRGSVGSKGGCG